MNIDFMSMRESAHRECKDCSLRSGCSQVVLPDAVPSDFMGLFAVGEAPGADEDRLGQGFVGSAGKKLDHILRSANPYRSVGRDEYGRANIVCCRPPNNRAPKKSEIETCSRWLKEALTSRFSARVVLAVGGTPSSYFYEGKSLFDIIGKADSVDYKPDLAWARDAGILVVPMPHTSPLAWNRSAPSGERWSEVGIRQVRKSIDLAVSRGELE